MNLLTMLAVKILPHLAVVALLLVMLKAVTARAKIRWLDRAFAKIHVPVALLLSVAVVVHGVFTTVEGSRVTMPDGSEWTIPVAVFVSGWLAAAGIIASALAFVFRQRRGGKWKAVHLWAGVLALAGTVWHLAAWYGQ